MNSHRRPFSAIERLEARDLMAGNIVAQKVGDDLIITGDDAGNNLEIQLIGDDFYELRGNHNESGLPDTTINGALGWVFDGISGNIVIRLQGGNDALFVVNQSMVVKKALVIDMGAGSDVINTTSSPYLSIGTELLVNLGDGSDSINMRNGTVGTSAVIDAGGGNDRISLLFVGVVQDLVIRGGDDGDAISLLSSRGDRYALVDGQGGTDFLHTSFCLFRRDVAIIGGQGADNVEVQGCSIEASLLVDHGTDYGKTAILRTAGHTVYILGEGQQLAEIFESKVGRVELGLKGGNDAVQIYASILDEIYLALGAGDDGVEVSYSIVNTRASVAAGVGSDRFVNRQNQFASLQAFDFELTEIL